MAVQLDHFIVSARDKAAAGRQLAALLDVPCGAAALGPFFETDEAFPIEHFCFRVSDTQFDAILSRIQAAGIAYRSAVRGAVDHRVSTEFGGRGVYWNVPEGHQWEMVTVSYARAPREPA